VTQPANEAPQTTAKTDTPVRAPAPAPATTPDNDPNSVKVEKKGDVTIRSFGATPAKTSEESAKKLTLVVRASENSWISVTSDGQPLTQETLIAPAATSFHATRELIVRVGNAAGVSFLWNGEELAPQGAEAEAKTYVFDAQGMHAASPPQN
jgi:cytoskeleton protein RodZ